MIVHAWSVLCSKTITDKDTNNISLDVIEQITIKGQLPEEATDFILPTRLEFISLWYKDQDEIDRTNARSIVIAPNGLEITNAEVTLDLSQNRRYRSRCVLNGLPIPKGQPGIYHFITQQFIAQKWVQVADIPFELAIEADQKT